MNTTELIALLAPHREALKELGWSITALGDNAEYVYVDQHEPSTSETLTTEYASLIIESIVRRELDRIAPSPVQVFTLANGRVTVGVAGSKPHTIRMQPTRLAALLQLWSWCREVKG